MLHGRFVLGGPGPLQAFTGALAYRHGDGVLVGDRCWFGCSIGGSLERTEAAAGLAVGHRERLRAISTDLIA